MIKEFLCKIGIHWMKNHRSYFSDCASSKTVFLVTCSCNREWMVDSLFPIVTFKVETNESVNKTKVQKT